MGKGKYFKIFKPKSTLIWISSGGARLSHILGKKEFKNWILMELGVWREERLETMNEIFVYIVMKYLPIGACCLYVLVHNFLGT